MMGRALLVVGWLGTVGLLATGVMGYTVDRTSGSGLETHMILALVSCLLILFSHCWIMFYLIGTGKAIKQAVAEHRLEEDLVERTKELKNESYPGLMLAMGLAMATFMVGGAALFGAIPFVVHHGLFLVTLPVQVWVLVRETRVLIANEALMAGIDRRLAAAVGSEA